MLRCSLACRTRGRELSMGEGANYMKSSVGEGTGWRHFIWKFVILPSGWSGEGIFGRRGLQIVFAFSILKFNSNQCVNELSLQSFQNVSYILGYSIYWGGDSLSFWTELQRNDLSYDSLLSLKRVRTKWCYNPFKKVSYILWYSIYYQSDSVNIRVYM